MSKHTPARELKREALCEAAKRARRCNQIENILRHPSRAMNAPAWEINRLVSELKKLNEERSTFRELAFSFLADQRKAEGGAA